MIYLRKNEICVHRKLCAKFGLSIGTYKKEIKLINYKITKSQSLGADI